MKILSALLAMILAILLTGCTKKVMIYPGEVVESKIQQPGVSRKDQYFQIVSEYKREANEKSLQRECLTRKNNIFPNETGLIVSTKIEGSDTFLPFFGYSSSADSGGDSVCNFAKTSITPWVINSAQDYTVPIHLVVWDKTEFSDKVLQAIVKLAANTTAIAPYIQQLGKDKVIEYSNKITGVVNANLNDVNKAETSLTYDLNGSPSNKYFPLKVEITENDKVISEVNAGRLSFSIKYKNSKIAKQGLYAGFPSYEKMLADNLDVTSSNPDGDALHKFLLEKKNNVMEGISSDSFEISDFKKECIAVESALGQYNLNEYDMSFSLMYVFDRALEKFQKNQISNHKRFADYIAPAQSDYKSALSEIEEQISLIKDSCLSKYAQKIAKIQKPGYKYPKTLEYYSNLKNVIEKEWKDKLLDSPPAITENVRYLYGLIKNFYPYEGDGNELDSKLSKLFYYKDTLFELNEAAPKKTNRSEIMGQIKLKEIGSLLCLVSTYDGNNATILSGVNRGDYDAIGIFESIGKRQEITIKLGQADILKRHNIHAIKLSDSVVEVEEVIIVNESNNKSNNCLDLVYILNQEIKEAFENIDASLRSHYEQHNIYPVSLEYIDIQGPLARLGGSTKVEYRRDEARGYVLRFAGEDEILGNGDDSVSFGRLGFAAENTPY
jgi:hypothetical protein